MSQSDRIQYRKLATQLQIAKFNPVFDSSNYTNFKSFGLVNNLKNTKIDQNELVIDNPNTLYYYDVALNNVLDISGNTTCENYLCKNYNYWPNRVPLAKIYSSPSPQNYFYWENFNVCYGDLQGNDSYGKSRINGCDVRLVVRTKDTPPNPNNTGIFYKNYK